MRKSNFITFTGIWIYPLACLFCWVLMIGINDTFAVSRELYLFIIFGVPIIFPIVVTTTNMQRKQRGQTDFSFSTVYKVGQNDPKSSKAYLKAAYPEVPQQFAYKVPEGLCLGTYKGKYACCPLVSDGLNATIFGSPGSGKSALLMAWIYSLHHRKEIAERAHTKLTGRPWNFFMVDVKGELYQRTLHITEKEYSVQKHKELVVVQPSNRESWGWDVFYRLKKPNLAETEYIKAITDIADALIIANADDNYFAPNARKILEGLLYYGAKSGKDFVTIIQEVMRSNLNLLIEEVVADAEAREMGIVLDKLKSFLGKDDNESVADIQTTLQTQLSVFSYPDIIYALQTNENKASPAVLDDGITNLDLAIEESLLLTYQPIFRLLTIQILRHCESDFKETDDRYTCLIWDEAARIGRVSGLEAALATLRSRHTAVLMLLQSPKQLEDVYGREKAQVILELCELKLFLSGSGSKESTEVVSSMAGEYSNTQTSYKRKGIMGGRSDSNFSHEWRPIVDSQTMMSLRQRNELIAFCYGKYMRLQKIRYWEDKYLAPVVKAREAKIRQQAQAEPEPNNTEE